MMAFQHARGVPNRHWRFSKRLIQTSSRGLKRGSHYMLELSQNRQSALNDFRQYQLDRHVPGATYLVGALRDKALKVKDRTGRRGGAEQAMPTDLAQRHEVLPGPVLCMEELNCWTRRPGL